MINTVSITDLEEDCKMEEKMINVPLEQYTDMAVVYGRTESLKEYVKNAKYAVDREVIAAIIGFELSMGGDDE